MQRNPIRHRHIDKHSPQPIISHGRQKIGHHPQLRASKRRRDGVAAECHGIIARDSLLIPRRNLIREKRDVDISLADKQSLQGSIP
jgi:hypothetical protein